jgi:ectoine hydroxylase-related dioxygenase (phytanoyl-CoA dioxygenase family)
MTDALFQSHSRSLDLHGYTIIKGLLTPAECDEAKAALDRIFAEERELPGAPQGPYFTAYLLMNKAPIFERVYQLPPLLRLVRHFLGEDACLSSVQAHRICPGATPQGLHYDGSVTGPFKSYAEADRGRRIVGHTLGLNVAFCISPFTRANGATRLVPGSHRCPDIVVPRDGAVPGEVIVEAPAGAAVIWDIATWHGASANSSGEVRDAVMTPWRRSWIRPEADLPRAILPDVLERAGLEGRLIFGFPSRSPYLDRWQWDLAHGRPIDAWAHRNKDEL